MTPSRQEAPRRNGGRANQKALTRSALLQAAAEMIQEGRPPSMPEAADRALVSVATAYRYFSSPEDLWWEASNMDIGDQRALLEAEQRVEAAGTNPQARLDALIRSVGFRMLDDQVPYRQTAKVAQEQWFRQADAPGNERVPVRQGRRNEQIRKVIVPLHGQLPKKDIDRIAHAHRARRRH